MRTIRRDRVLVVTFVLLFWTLFVAFAIGVAWSQPSGGYFSSGGQESSTWGRYKRMWNASGAEIAEGTVVMIDTVTAGVGPQIPPGKGFTTWDGSMSHVYRVVGITVGNIANYDQGYILVEGYHNAALVEATGYSGFDKLYPSLTTAGKLAKFTSATDSLDNHRPVVGMFHRYNSTSSLTSKVYVNFGVIPGRW